MLVLATDIKNVKIGDVYKDKYISVGGYKDTKITFRVIREATYEDYISQDPKPHNPVKGDDIKYYFVHTD